MSKTARLSVVLACAAAVYALGVFVRWGVLDVQAARHTGIPFTMESALSYYYGFLAKDGALPALDTSISGPEGLSPREDLNLLPSLLAAKIHAALACVSPITFEDFLRKATAPVFCLGVIAMFFLVRGISGGGLLMPVLAASAFAVAIPSVMRSTGQEWMTENIALPFLWLHFLFLTMALGKLKVERQISVSERDLPKGCEAEARSVKRHLSAAQLIISALTLAFAWMLWDMVQVYVLLLGAVSFLLLWKRLGQKEVLAYSATFAGTLLAVSLGDPYLRAHGAWGGYAVAVWAAFALAAWLSGKIPSKSSWFAMGALLGLFALAASNPVLKDSYGHFSSLLFYKLKFLNVKPENPALLPYEVRALWVPALHSGNWKRILDFWGPIGMLQALASLVLAWYWIKGRLAFEQKILLIAGLISALAAILFVRMEVFWIFFALGTVAAAFSGTTMARVVGSVSLAACLAFWAFKLPSSSATIGRDVDYGSLSGMVSWVQARTQPRDTILASYSLSPSLAAYAHRPIAIQPKYEAARFRRKIQLFEQALMAPKEAAFYSLCKTWGVRYYVHSKGFYADHSVNSFRYLVGDLQPSSETNLFKFEINPRLLNNFRLLYQNDKYLVYRVVDIDDLQKSRFCVIKGQACLTVDLPSKALRWCARALHLFPGSNDARVLAIRAHGALGDEEKARQEASLLFERMQVHRLREAVPAAGPKEW